MTWLKKHDMAKKYDMAKKILLVEDNRPLCIAMEKMAQHGGVELTITAFAEEGIDLLKQTPPYHLILLDIGLAGGNDGIDFIEKKKCLPAPKCEIPVIAFTGNASGMSQETYEEMGFKELITKPIDLSDIFSRIQKYL